MALATAAIFSVSIFTGCVQKESSSSKELEHSNPLSVAFGDPFILPASDGKYYMYGTGGVENGFGAYSSNDLAEWEFEGQVYRGDQSGSWTVKIIGHPKCTR